MQFNDLAHKLLFMSTTLLAGLACTRPHEVSETLLGPAVFQWVVEQRGVTCNPTQSLLTGCEGKQQ